ncbi:MAG: box helicase [Mycobacterium sp.]|nr:box helicase [Mycobacterium sp.]
MTRAEQALDGLWDHQRRAVDVARRYLAASSGEDQSSLITMPTGTGKTGVIAAITTCLPEITGHRLVLTPWDALVRQLIDDLSGRFWLRLPAHLRPPVMPVRRLPPASQLATLPTVEPTIFIATIAAVSVAARTAGTHGYDLSEVFANFGCVLVDEGHYEPAVNWSEAIRSLRRPTILLTATPYRNDRKYFNIKDWRYRLPHHEAVEEQFLREPNFIELDRNSTPRAFVKQLIGQVDSSFPNSDDARVIVRCATDGAIRLVVNALRSEGETAIGVHEQFQPDEAPHLLRTVPSTDGQGPKYWVHQNKLIEGIDDPRFKVLAFYDPLKNGRAIIQQIGRVLRNPSRDPKNMQALVMSRGDSNIRRNWESYRAFDLQNDAESVATLPGLITAILKAQPVSFYYDGGYRSAVDLDSEHAWREFSFPLRTRIFRRRLDGDQLSIDQIAGVVEREWNALDRSVYRIQRPDASTCVVPFVRAVNSRFLRDSTFIEPTFGYTVIRLDGGLIFLYDTAGATPAVIDDAFVQLRPPDLQTLFPRDGSELTSVALLNTDVGRQAPRSRQVRAAAIADLAPDLADYAYVCTVAEGYTVVAGDRFRRYVGMSRSRVNDFRSGDRDFVAYSAWLDEIRDELAASGKGSSTFTRYASFVNTPSDKAPTNVLLDVDPSMFWRIEDGERLQIEDRAAEADADGHFIIAVNNDAQHQARIRWIDDRERYEVSCPSLVGEQYVDILDERRELISVINSEQLLRIVPRGRDTIYAHGNFFTPTIPTSRTGDFQLLDILHPAAKLRDVLGEKGQEVTDDDWDAKSVFGVISALSPSSSHTPDSEMSRLAANLEMLLCTDMGSEVADFVLTTPNRVAFIHAKAARKKSYCSASALHDVASQALKNLTHLQPLTNVPMKRGSWTKPWSSGHVSGTTYRLRHGSFDTSDAMWKHIRAHITDPDIDREVWIVLGKAMSKEKLQEQARKRRPSAEAIQVFALLQATWGAVSQLGARLRIFCSP